MVIDYGVLNKLELKRDAIKFNLSFNGSAFHTLILMAVVNIRAQLPAHRAYSLEGGPGYGTPQRGI